MSRFLCFGLVASGFLMNAGCRAPDNRQGCNPNDPRPVMGFVPPAPPVPLAPAGPPPSPSPSFMPPGGFPRLPPQGSAPPPPAGYVPPQGQPPVSYAPPNLEAPTITNVPPLPARTETQWQPAEAREPAPRPESNRDVPPRVELYAPEPAEKNKSSDQYYQEPPPIEAERKSETPKKKPDVQATFPPIPQFTVVRDKVFAGLRPNLDGLDWLQSNGVRTVVKLRLPGADDSADRVQVKKRSMRFLPIEISPQTLTRAQADEFVALVRGASKDSIFVYDHDGALAGAMWYLYLRLGEFMDDDAAQLRSIPHGLQINRAGIHREMWLAAQRVISN